MMTPFATLYGEQPDYNSLKGKYRLIVHKLLVEMLLLDYESVIDPSVEGSDGDHEEYVKVMIHTETQGKRTTHVICCSQQQEDLQGTKYY
ncbi:hypothetical protein KY289_016784 [Solanum tuberosum]|nr:hypothetical protein KY289_016784 [Solanum tuberosum]